MDGLALLAQGSWIQRIILGDDPSVWLRAVWLVTLVGVFFGVVGAVGALGIWWERKVSARIQARIGPNRVGPMGLFQSIADGIKLITKEDLTPAGADSFLFKLAPYLAFAPVFAAYLALPFGPDVVFEPKLSVGIFWVMAILGVEVIGVILAGWASNNKWSMYGAMREACQLVSYEIPLGISMIVVILSVGTLDLVKLSNMQTGGVQTWLVFSQPFVMMAFVVFFVASLAANKRAPFDLPESDSELVAGYHTEYSGLRFSLFFFAEYAAMFVLGAVQVVLFLGGWNDPFGMIAVWHAKALAAYQTSASAENILFLILVNLAGVGCFVSKVIIIIFMQMWVRWTLPRPRIDQVLHACVKVLLPLSCALMLGSAMWEWLVPQDSSLQTVTQYVLAGAGVAFMGLVVLFVLGAFIQGRRTQQRLTPPAPIGVAR